MKTHTIDGDKSNRIPDSTATGKEPSGVTAVEPTRYGRALRSAHSWALWTTSVPARMYVLTVEAVVLGVVVVAVMQVQWDPTPARHLAVLLTLSLGYAAAVDRITMLRRYLQLGDKSTVWTNQTSIWTFAAALTLPLSYAVVLVLAIYGRILIRGWRQQTIRTYRVVFAIATTLIGVCAAAGLAHIAASTAIGVSSNSLRPNLVTAGQLTAYTMLSLAAAVGGIRLYGGVRSLRTALPPRRAVGTEILTLLLGVIAAQLLVRDIWLTPLVIAFAVALHRSSLVHQLAAAARVDAKTGLLNASAWRERASQELARADRNGQTVTMLLIDLDHFKQVNDEHGHLAGDKALRAVGDSLRSVLRGYDDAGRFGGEEFVVLLPDAGADDAGSVADRIRHEITHRSTELGFPVTASIGAATATRAASTVDDLLAAADLALYSAKTAGRDRVQFAPTQAS
jgi:diguanylate cyclase (GGDEF)-like protein